MDVVDPNARENSPESRSPGNDQNAPSTSIAGTLSYIINEKNFNVLKDQFSSIFLLMIGQIMGIIRSWKIHNISQETLDHHIRGLAQECKKIDNHCMFLKEHEEHLPDCYKTLEKFAHSFKTLADGINQNMLNYFASKSKDDSDYDKKTNTHENVLGLLDQALTSIDDAYTSTLQLTWQDRIDYPQKTFDVSIIDAPLPFLLPLMQNKNIQFTQDRELPNHYTSYPDVYSLALENILSNAIKFTPEGGTIDLSIKEGENAILIEISDTGCGIPDDFDSFVRGNTTDPQGTGLGLSQTKEAIEKVGGTITHRKNIPQGTIFSFTLPATIQNK